MPRPRWSLDKPSPEVIAAFHAAQRASAFSYEAIGQTQHETTVAGYNNDHHRCFLGTGAEAFEAGCAALRSWRMFPAPWTRIEPADAPLREGQTIAMLAHAFGWWLNACRIVYVIDTTSPLRRFGFAYGTLAAHVEQGEERFLVEMLPDGGVWYDLRAFSRPRFWMVRLGKPLARRLQRRFGRESLLAMRAAVRDAMERQ